MPQVSVIIPTYNAASYLTEAIESVLAQTYRDFEILVIDDGSTDDTSERLKHYGTQVRYLSQPNSGVAVARNRGIAESRGRYVAFLDADDTWLPRKLERQMDALLRESSARASNTTYFVTRTDLTRIAEVSCQRKATALEDLILRGTVIFISTVVCEKELLEQTSGFDPALSQCADWDMWIRVAAHTDFVGVDEPLVNYRQHASNMSRNARLLERDSVRVLEKAFRMNLPPALSSKRRQVFARNYMVVAGTYFRARFYADFVRCVIRALASDVRQVRYLINFPGRVLARHRSASRAAQ